MIWVAVAGGVAMAMSGVAVARAHRAPSPGIQALTIAAVLLAAEVHHALGTVGAFEAAGLAAPHVKQQVLSEGLRIAVAPSWLALGFAAGLLPLHAWGLRRAARPVVTPAAAALTLGALGLGGWDVYQRFQLSAELAAVPLDAPRAVERMYEYVGAALIGYALCVALTLLSLVLGVVREGRDRRLRQGGEER